MNPVVALLICSVVVVTSSCYHYVPATLETVPEGSRLRALLTPEAQQRLQERYRVDADPLEGTVLSRDGDRLSFFVPSPPTGTAFGAQEVLYQQVDVARGDILRVDVRRLDAFRTATLIGVGAAAATLVILESRSGFLFGDGGDGGNVPPESVRGPLITIPVVRW